MLEYTTNWTDQYADTWRQLIGHLAGTKCNLIEIGNWEGRSTGWLLDNLCSDRDSRLTAIDPHFSHERYARFLGNVSQNKYVSRLNVVRELSADYLGTLPAASIDACYIDGSHEAVDVMTDAVLCWRLLKPGGVIIFDDYEWDGPRELMPRVAINSFVELVAPWSNVVHRGWQLAMIKQGG